MVSAQASVQTAWVHSVALNPGLAAAAPRFTTQAAGAQPGRKAERRAAAGKRARGDAARRNSRARSLAAAAAVAPAAANPRLRLEPAEPALTEEALAIERAIEVVARAASAARAAASAASQAQARISTLERNVGELRSEADGQRAVSEQLRAKLAQNDNASRWFWPLVAAVLLLTGLAFWLARRLVVVQREYQARWLTVAPAGALPPPTSTSNHAEAAALAGPSLPGAEVRQLGSPSPSKPPAASAWPATPPIQPPEDDAMRPTRPMSPPPAPTFVPDSPLQRTQVLPPGLGRDSGEEGAAAPRDVSIEELIDLEQQAEFFVVLGQDDAAIELLTEHLRNTGGGSPLPYLKLLEIFQRRGDHADYERIRARFNHRFNAYAPEWGSDLAAGRSLEDYSGIVPRLQQAWPRPLDAMAEMEALLFRKSRGDLFDLAAYRELLFLYSLARDLLDREGADTGNVDLLLPLSSVGAEFGSTAPAPYLGLESAADHDRGHGDGDRPTLPLDFDLSVEAERQPSIFDPLDRHGRPTTGR